MKKIQISNDYAPTDKHAQPKMENWVFSLSKSEVEHKLMLHWFSAPFFLAWQCTFLCSAHGKLYFLFLHIPKQSTQDNCETDGYSSQRFSDLWKVDLWLEGLWFEFRGRLQSEIVSHFSIRAAQLLKRKTNGPQSPLVELLKGSINVWMCAPIRTETNNYFLLNTISENRDEMYPFKFLRVQGHIWKCCVFSPYLPKSKNIQFHFQNNDFSPLSKTSRLV